MNQDLLDLASCELLDMTRVLSSGLISDCLRDTGTHTQTVHIHQPSIPHTDIDCV